MAKRTRALGWGIGIGLVVLAVLSAFTVFPEVVRRRAIADAKARGVQLTIDTARLSSAGVRFSKLEAHLEKVPGAVATIAEASVELSGLSAEAVELRGVDITIPDFLAASAQIEEQRAAAGQGETALQRIVFKDALVHLTRFAGASTSLEIAGASAEFVTSPGGDEAHMRADEVSGTLGASPFGPWRIGIDRTREGESMRMMMDPSKPDLEHVRMSTSTSGESHFDVSVPRTHVRSLGLPFSAFGLAADEDPEIEVDASSMQHGAADRDGAMLFQAWGVHLGALPSALDVRIGAKWKGQGDTVAIHDGVFLIGPFGGSLRGTVRARPAQWRLDFTFDSEPVPCADLGPQKAPLGILGSFLGTKPVSGTVMLSGSLVFDLTNPAENRLTLKPSADCSFTLR